MCVARGSCAAGSRRACEVLRCRSRTPVPIPRRAAPDASSGVRGGWRACAVGRTRSASDVSLPRLRRTTCAARSSSRPSAWIVGSSSARPGAPQLRLQPRDELARRRTLGHVVVCSRLQRRTFSVLVADRGQDDDRHLRSTRAARALYLYAVAVRQHEVDDRRVRRPYRRAVERLLCRRRRDRPRSLLRAARRSARAGSAARRRTPAARHAACAARRRAGSGSSIY